MSGQIRSSVGSRRYRGCYRQSALSRIEGAADELIAAIGNLQEARITGYDARLLALSAEIYDLASAMQRRRPALDILRKS